MEGRPLVRVRYNENGSSFMTSNEDDENNAEDDSMSDIYYETLRNKDEYEDFTNEGERPPNSVNYSINNNKNSNSSDVTTNYDKATMERNVATHNKPLVRSFRGEVTPDDSLGDFIHSTPQRESSGSFGGGEDDEEEEEDDEDRDGDDENGSEDSTTSSSKKRRKRKKKKTGSTLYLWLSGLIICLSAFNFGYNTTALNLPTQPNSEAPILFHLSSNDVPEPGLSKTQIELATSTITFGALFGVFLVSYPNERYGRKVALTLNNVFFVCGSLLCSSAVSFGMLIAGRFLTGIGTGAAAVVVPQLLAEISPSSVRGSFTALNTLSISIGTLSSALVFFSMPSFANPTVGWRLTLGISALPAVMQVLLTLGIPESPYWLIKKKRSSQAKRVLQRMRPDGWPVVREMAQISQNLRSVTTSLFFRPSIDDIDNSDTSHNSSKYDTVIHSLRLLFFKHKKQTFLSLFFMFAQQFTGINVVLSYSSTLFGFAGIETTPGKSLATIGVMLLNAIATSLSFWLLDRWGRRPLLISGLFLMFVSLTTAGFVLLFTKDPNARGFVALLMILIDVTGYAIGLGAVVWALVSEILPSDVRSRGLGLCVLANSLFNAILRQTALDIIYGLGNLWPSNPVGIETVGTGFLFIIFAVVSLLSLFIVIFTLPETKGKSFSEVDQLMYS
eukprot:TRINITY_DN10572_c0_g1_i1.p1 TRINITY_DN10572_c0_g1~~TRINITY_DN10572_c0_g1_i1.p1  ORF type:complete len:672 (-),score=150.45 TRINITY_DN10572_c0_g1_i1:2-2017(-)